VSNSLNVSRLHRQEVSQALRQVGEPPVITWPALSKPPPATNKVGSLMPLHRISSLCQSTVVMTRSLHIWNFKQHTRFILLTARSRRQRNNSRGQVISIHSPREGPHCAPKSTMQHTLQPKNPTPPHHSPIPHSPLPRHNISARRPDSRVILNNWPWRLGVGSVNTTGMAQPVQREKAIKRSSLTLVFFCLGN
jgi:hypothetical protein